MLSMLAMIAVGPTLVGAVTLPDSSVRAWEHLAPPVSTQPVAATAPSSVDSMTFAPDSSATPAPATLDSLVAWPVLLDSVPVYVAVGADTATAQAAATRVGHVIDDLRRRARPPVIRLQERDGTGFLLVDSVIVLAIGPDNRVDADLSPLANALMLHEQLLLARERAMPATSWDEEDLLLRLLLGIIYPVTLLVVLRMTRFGLRKWERDWRRALIIWLARYARRRGVEASRQLARRLVNVLTGIERTVVYGTILVAVSFTWFALFPQTRPLATALLDHVIGPMLALLGGTARGGLLIVYSLFVILVAVRLTGALSRRHPVSPTQVLLGDPLILFPLRVAVWVVALFLVLLPYPGAPRLIGVGILLLVLLGVLVALRPLIEEIAIGIYVNNHYDLRLGRAISIDGVPAVVVAARLAHLEVARGPELHSVPYSRILKADVSLDADAGGSYPHPTRERSDT